MTRPLPADAPRRKLGRPPAPKKVFMKFYTADWRADLDLRSCSFAARGLWMDMLSMMAEAEPYGHLVVSGRPITTRQLARLLAGDEAEVKGLLAELDAAGVFSRTEEGVIYSRRMVRDAEKSEEGKQLIARRWGKRDDERPQLRVVGGGEAPPAPHSRITEIRDLRNTKTPDLRNTYSQSPESPPLPPAGDPCPRSLRGDAGLKDWPRWKREALRPEQGTGRMTCGAVYWDVAQRVVAEAARLPGGVAWKGNWEPLSRWLLGSGEYPPRTLEDIVAAIARRAARDDYEVPHSSLALFDQVVWAYGTRGRR